MKYLVCLIGLGLIQLTMIQLNAQSISNSTYSTFNSKEIISPFPTNFSAFRDSITRSKEINILRDAGVPCRMEFQVHVGIKGEYLTHSFLGDKCHPLAENAFNRLIPILTFESGKKNGVAEKMWVDLSFWWHTQ